MVHQLRTYYTATLVNDLLGPGQRSAIWVQGCSIGCPGCMAPEMRPNDGGRWALPEKLAVDLMVPGTEGITVSGGEPTEQPDAVADLLHEVKSRGGNTWVYTGRRFEELKSSDVPGVARMLALTDVLVDGPYDPELSGNYRFRGSSNQRILRLTEAIPWSRIAGPDVSRFEIRLPGADQILMIGIPPGGLMERLKASLRARGIEINGWSALIAEEELRRFLPGEVRRGARKEPACRPH